MNQRIFSWGFVGILALSGCANNGATGPQGPAGADGNDGIAGTRGQDGEAGAQGAEGPAGPAFSLSVNGSVMGPGGAVANTPLVLSLLNAQGEEIGTIAAGSTDASGNFSVGVANFTGAVRGMLIRVAEDSGDLVALVTGDTGVEVNVASTGVANWLRAISEGGSVPLSEFTNVEIDSLVSDGMAGLTTAGTDLSDGDAVFAQLAADLETDVAVAATAGSSIQALANPVVADPPDVVTTIASFVFELTDGDGEIWDIEASGTISDGSEDSYDTAFDLSIDGNSFPDQAPNTTETTVEDDREAVLGPVLDLGGTGLDVTRKIYVSGDMGFARFTEILSNNTVADITLDVEMESNLGSDESNTSVFDSSAQAATAATEGDTWITNHQDTGDSAVGFLFPGAVPTKEDDNVDWVWPDVTIPAGETVVLVSWGLQATGDFPEAVQGLSDRLRELPEIPPSAYWQGLTVAEAGASQLISPVALVGEPGLVAPGATVTFTVNDDGLGGFDRQGTVQAGTDGSIQISQAGMSGDVVTLTTENGTDLDVTIP